MSDKSKGPQLLGHVSYVQFLFDFAQGLMIQVSLFFIFQTIQLTKRLKFEHDVFDERVSKALPETDLFNKVLNQCIGLNPIFLDLNYCSHRCVNTAILVTDFRSDRGFWRCGALILEETFDQGCVIDR